MGRPIVLSNGQLFVGLDEHGLVHDFYFPYVGLDNLTNARHSAHKIGIWVDGQFSWVDDGAWDITLNMSNDRMVGTATMVSKMLNVQLDLQDYVDTHYNAFIRHIRIANTATKRRDVRLFMHQVFEISRAGRADTALYVPDDNYILDYKGNCCLLIAGKAVDKQDFDQFAVGNYGIEGKQGTYVDAEDGELSGNPVEHGGVDSVIRFRRELDGGEAYDIDYWVVAATSQNDAQLAHTHLKYHPLANRLHMAERHWKAWLEPATHVLATGSAEQQAALQKSLMVIKAHCDERGSILASGDSSIFNFGRDYYCYCWPRDAAYAVWPMVRCHLYEEAKKFFLFARDTRHHDGYLMHKYQPDKAIGSTWHPLLHNRSKELAIQEDETATVLFMIGEYYRNSKDQAFIEEMFDSFIAPAANFMSTFVDKSTGLPHASYDLWEQKFLTSTYTVCTVIAALETAVDLAKLIGKPVDTITLWQQAAATMLSNMGALYHPSGYFRKGFLLQDNGDLAYDDTVDISNLYGPFMFARLPLNDPRLLSTVAVIEQRLLNTSPIGGVIRYEHDGYFLAKSQYKGNPWVVCTLWLAQYYHAAGRLDEANTLLQWSLNRMLPSGVLSEQFDPDNGTSIGVTPLVWSHAELINTLLDVLKQESK